MCSHVNLQVSVLIKYFPTDIARVWPDVGVNSDVNREGRARTEHFTTDGTGVWFYAGVSSHVKVEARALSEQFQMSTHNTTKSERTARSRKNFPNRTSKLHCQIRNKSA